MANIEFTATATGDITPKWTFTGEVIDVWVDGVDKGDLTSGVEATIAVVNGNAISYRTTGDWTGVTQIEMQDDTISGSIAGLSQLTSLTHLYLHFTSVSGDISSLSGLTSLTRLYLNSTSVSGDISNLSNLTSLEILHLSGTPVSGDISNLSGLTSLTHLYLHFTSVSGNISSLSGLTSLIDFYLSNTSVSGDANCLDTQVLMTTFQGQNCSWTQTEVDNALASLVVNEAAGDAGRDCTVNVGGNNASPSIAGLIHKTILEAEGWTITITAASSFYANGLIDNIMFFSKELSAVDALNIYNQTKWRYGV